MQLYKFQEQYLEGLPPKFIFSADTGTGKSYMALAHYYKHSYPKPLLILGPAAKMRTGDWERHVATFFADKELPEVHYYSYEKFSRNATVKQYKATGTRGVWHDWLLRFPTGECAIIADECHRAAEATTLTGKAVFALASRADFFVGLSATALPNGWRSAGNYFKIWGFTPNITAFRKRYLNIQTYKGFPEVVGYFNEDELKNLWNRISKPLHKEEAIDLPPLTSIRVPLKSGTGYKTILKERLVDGKFLDNPSALLHALRQANTDVKLPWLDEALADTSSNVVIFYNYVSERQAILELIRKKHKGRKVFRQDGEKHEIPQNLRVGDWDNLERTITLAQYQSGSTGVEMQYADTIIFFSPTYSYTLYHQSIGRIERIGQANKMTAYELYCPGTIEYDVWQALAKKQDFSERQWITENVTQEEEW